MTATVAPSRSQTAAQPALSGIGLASARQRCETRTSPGGIPIARCQDPFPGFGPAVKRGGRICADSSMDQLCFALAAPGLGSSPE